MSRELLLVGVGRMGRPYVAAARRLGLRVHAVEASSRLAGVERDVETVHACRGELDEHWAEAASAAARLRRPDGIVAFSEPQVIAAALVADELGLPGPSLHAAVISRNKALQRGLFAARGIRQPEYVVGDDLTAHAEWAARRLPVVVKALSGAGSHGVELVDEMDSFRAAAARRAGEPALVVETAVVGPEYSWEAIVVDRRVRWSNTTAKETTGPPSFVEVAHRTGVAFPRETAAAVDRLADGVLRGLGMRTGVVHLEFRLAADGPTLIEVAVRTPGDFLMDAISLTYGVDWFELVVRAAMSMPLPDPPARPVRYAATYMPLATAGIVTRIEGVAEVMGHPCVTDIGLRVAEGDQIGRLESSDQRVGHVVLAADSPEELEAGLAEVRGTLAVVTTGDPVGTRGSVRSAARAG